jgi:AcrR family transcriptional regulator
MTGQDPRSPAAAAHPRRRRLQPAGRRQELLEAAVRVLRRLGPDGCRVQDITAEAGTAKGNFYRYFPTWDDLLLAVRAHLLDRYSEEARQRYAGRTGIDWNAVIDDETDRFLTFQLGLAGLHEAVFHGPASRAEPVSPAGSAASLIAWLLRAGTAAGAFAGTDVDVTARLIFHLLHGAADEIAAGADRQQIQQATLAIIHRALAPSRSQQPAAASSRHDPPEQARS